MSLNEIEIEKLRNFARFGVIGRPHNWISVVHPALPDLLDAAEAQNKLQFALSDLANFMSVTQCTCITTSDNIESYVCPIHRAFALLKELS